MSHHEQTVSFDSSQVISSSTQTAETTPGTRSPLVAINVAIENQVKADTPKTTQKKRQIDRPYGESISTTEAYEKLLAKETTRKRRATKKQDEAADGEKPKAARGSQSPTSTQSIFQFTILDVLERNPSLPQKNRTHRSIILPKSPRCK